MRSSPVSLTMPSATSSLRPMSSTVSIIPGIENLAPERHDSSSGSDDSPKRFPALSWTSSRAARTCSHIPSAKPSFSR